MNLSYDYTELISELAEEISLGILTQNEAIQVVRSERDAGNDYRPIIDWYYSEAKMIKLLEVDATDSEFELKEKQKMKNQYNKNKHLMREILVSECMNEMQNKNKRI